MRQEVQEVVKGKRQIITDIDRSSGQLRQTVICPKLFHRDLNRNLMNHGSDTLTSRLYTQQNLPSVDSI